MLSLLLSTTGSGIESVSDAVDTAVTEVQDLLAGLAASLPRILIALVVFAGFWAVARLLRRGVRPRLVEVQGESIGRVLTSLTGGVVITIGAFVAAAVAFPTVNMATLLGAGGVVALAAGFAFQDIFENLMAGLLLLVRQPFEEGDFVEVDGATGSVEAITIRETRIRRPDRQLMVVPNAEVYKNAIRIQTDREAVRTSLLVGVGYDDDLELAERVAVETLRDVDGVLADPAPQALYTEFGGSSINLDLRYFTGSAQGEVRRVLSAAVKAIKAAFDERDIDIPFPIRTLDATDDVAAAMRAISGSSTNGNGRHARPARRRVVRTDS